jgi:hypothetical protein
MIQIVYPRHTNANIAENKKDKTEKVIKPSPTRSFLLLASFSSSFGFFPQNITHDKLIVTIPIPNKKLEGKKRSVKQEKRETNKKGNQI